MPTLCVCNRACGTGTSCSKSLWVPLNTVNSWQPLPTHCRPSKDSCRKKTTKKSIAELPLLLGKVDAPFVTLACPLCACNRALWHWNSLLKVSLGFLEYTDFFAATCEHPAMAMDCQRQKQGKSIDPPLLSVNNRRSFRLTGTRVIVPVSLSAQRTAAVKR